MRRHGEMPYSWIADGTRWQRKPETHESIEAALRDTANFYRRSLWNAQDWYVEVWLEKEALAGVIYQVTERWDVPLMVTRGYPSLSYLASAAEAIADADAHGKGVGILYLGDRDPSGDDIARNVEEQLCEMSSVDIAFTRVAVTEAQIEEYDLPTRPTKRTDTRAAAWGGTGSVEVDAIDPDELRGLVDDEIWGYVDVEQLTATRAAEESEREVMRRIVAREFTTDQQEH
jgi:hypothetical protein